jgi:hypothetical protein
VPTRERALYFWVRAESVRGPADDGAYGLDEMGDSRRQSGATRSFKRI